MTSLFNLKYNGICCFILFMDFIQSLFEYWVKAISRNKGCFPFRNYLSFFLCLRIFIFFLHIAVNFLIIWVWNRHIFLIWVHIIFLKPLVPFLHLFIIRILDIIKKIFTWGKNLNCLNFPFRVIILTKLSRFIIKLQ